MLPVNHEQLRELERNGAKLLKDIREQYGVYSEHEDRTSAEAQEAKQKYEQMNTEWETLNEKIERVKDDIAEQRKFEDREARHREFSRDIDSGRLSQEDVANDPNAPVSAVGSADLAEDEAYREAFFNLIRVEGREHNLSQEHRDILARGSANQIEQRGLTTKVASGAGGGNLIPVTLMNRMIEYTKFFGPLVPNGGLAFDWATDTGNSREIPYIDDTANSGEDLAEAKRLIVDTPARGTNSPAIDTDPSIKKLSSTVTTYDSKMVLLTRELIQDSEVGSIENIIGRLLGIRLGRSLNAAFTTVLTGAVPAANTLTTASGNTTTWTIENVMELVHEIDPSYRGVGVTGAPSGSNLTYMFNDDVFKTLRLMKLPLAGTKASGYTVEQYAFTIANNLANGEPDRFLGRPFALNNNMPAVKKSTIAMVVGDFENLWIRTATPIFLEVARELFIDRLLVGLMAWQRAGALVVNPNTFAALKTAAS